MTNNTHCGFVALVGRPNVGKSTLLNRILGQKISIVSAKPQTTRHQILGIHSTDNTQIIFVDTPGLHDNANSKKQLNRYMNRAASNAAAEADLAILIVEAMNWTPSDERILAELKTRDVPVALAVNKIDTVHPREQLLEFLQTLTKLHDFCFIVPLSAQRGENVQPFLNDIHGQLPESPFFFSPDQVTDKSERFITSELVREKIMLQLNQELPYATSVEIEHFHREETPKGERLNIGVVIWVERAGQKGIIIGKGGETLKRIGTQARQDLEQQFGEKVFLKTWVKVRENWSDDARSLQQFGYE